MFGRNLKVGLLVGAIALVFILYLGFDQTKIVSGDITDVAPDITDVAPDIQSNSVEDTEILAVENLPWSDRISEIQKQCSPAELSDQLERLAEQLNNDDWSSMLEFWRALPIGKVSWKAFVVSVNRISPESAIEILDNYNEAAQYLTDEQLNSLRSNLVQGAVRAGSASEAFELLLNGDVISGESERADALGTLIWKWSFIDSSRAAGALNRLPDSRAKDAIIVERLNGLDSMVEEDEGQLLTLFDSITTPELRAQFLSKLASVYANVNPTKILEENVYEGPGVETFQRDVFQIWAEVDTNSAMAWLGNNLKLIEGSIRDEWISRALLTIAKHDEEAAYAWAERIDNEQIRNESVEKIRSIFHPEASMP